VADGVTNSRFSGELARLLVKRWTDSPLARGESFREWLRPVQDAWAAEVAPARADVETQWFNRNAQWVGHSTFVGLSLEGRTLRAVGIGDAVVIQVRGNRVVRAWPNEHASDFRSQTEALPSAGDPTWPIRETDIAVEAGDEIFMLSDAIGSWTLREAEAGRNPFAALRRMNRPGLMQRFVEGHRAHSRNANLMDVDDTTLVRFVVPE
jgi:hypothetical protein